MDLTWEDIYGYVREIHEREGGKVNKAFYLATGNVALMQMSRICGGIYTSLSNVAGGGLTVNGRVVTLPNNVLSVESVRFDGHELTVEALAEDDRGHGTDRPRHYKKTGRTLILDRVPSSADPEGFTLVAWCWVNLGKFSETSGALNPLSLLPEDCQIYPAYYSLSKLPARVRTIQEGGRILGVDKSEQDRKTEYQALWQQALSELADAFRQETCEAYTGS
jgi:hypothetical protein